MYTIICAVLRASGSGQSALVTVDATDVEGFDRILRCAIKAETITRSGPRRAPAPKIRCAWEARCRF
jgi:hypothetical protein